MSVLLSGAVILIAVLCAGCLVTDKYQTTGAPEQCSKTLVTGQNMIINETLNDATICANAEDAFTLQLGENSRTGYQWQLTSSPGLEIIDGDVRWYDEKGLPTRMPGIKGVHEWNITAKKTGIQTIKAVLQRPERVTGDELVFHLTVIVK